MILKAGRDYRLVKEPLLRTTTRGVDGLLVVSRYLLIDPDGKVLKVDKMQWGEDGQFAIELPERLPPGQYTVILGIFLDGNSLQPSARIAALPRRRDGFPGLGGTCLSMTTAFAIAAARPRTPNASKGRG